MKHPKTLAFICLSVSLISTLHAQSNLVAYYTFTEGKRLADSSGHGNTLTINTAEVMALGRDGEINSAAGFTGNQTYTPGNPADMQFSEHDFSVVFWIKPTGSYSNSKSFITKGVSRGNNMKREFDFFGREDSIAVYLGDTSGNGQVIALGLPPADNVWQQLVLTYNAQTKEVRYYYNGVLNKAQKTQSNIKIQFANDNWNIGGIGVAALNTATMDDIRFYDGALSASEIATLYDTEAPQTKEPPYISKVLADFLPKNTYTTTYPVGAAYKADTVNYVSLNSANVLKVNDARNMYYMSSTKNSVNIDTSPYVTITLNLKGPINFDRFVLHGVGSYYGNMKFQLRWSVDSFAVSLGEMYPTQSSFQLASVDLASQKMVTDSSVEFRLYFYAGSNSVYLVEGNNYPTFDGTPAIYRDHSKNISIWYKQIRQPCPAVTASATQSELSVTAPLGGRYQWIDCNNNNSALVGERSQTFTPGSNGSYAVIAVSNGCIDTSACTLVSSVTGIQDAQVTRLTVYPNPTSGTIQLPANASYTEVILYDSQGRILMHQPADPTHSTLYISGPAGLYHISLLNGSKAVAGFNVIKK